MQLYFYMDACTDLFLTHLCIESLNILNTHQESCIYIRPISIFIKGFVYHVMMKKYIYFLPISSYCIYCQLPTCISHIILCIALTILDCIWWK